MPPLSFTQKRFYEDIVRNVPKKYLYLAYRRRHAIYALASRRYGTLTSDRNEYWHIVFDYINRVLPAAHSYLQQDPYQSVLDYGNYEDEFNYSD